MKKILISALALLLVSFAPAPKSVKLEYTFKVGDKFEWTQNAKQTITQSFFGNTQEIASTVNAVIKFGVVELTPTGAKMEIEYQKLNLTMKTPMAEVSIDSDMAEPNDESKIAKSMMGKKFYFYFTKGGVVEKVEGIDNIWTGLSTLNLSEQSLATTKQLLERSFGEESMKGSLESAMIHYPDVKVKKGDTWKQTTTSTMGFPMAVENTWQLDDLSSSSATISMQGALATADKEKITDLPNQMKAKFDLSGTQNASGTTDIKTGWPSDFKSTSNLKGKMILLAGGPIPSDMEIPMELLTQSTFKLIKK